MHAADVGLGHRELEAERVVDEQRDDARVGVHVVADVHEALGDDAANGARIVESATVWTASAARARAASSLAACVWQLVVCRSYSCCVMAPLASRPT